jgi:hypothetical protein
LKLEFREAFFEACKIADDVLHGIAVVLFLGKRQQIFRIRQAAAKLVQRDDYELQRSAFLAQRLRALRIVPDVGLLEFALYFGESLCLGLIVKGTPSTHSCVQLDQRWSV